MARASGVVPWRYFMRALAEEIDRLSEPAQRDELLSHIGWRMANQMPLGGAMSLDGLETEINNALGTLEWGEASLVFDEADHSIRILHVGLPELGSLGPWFAATLEGLYGAWLSNQPGADKSLRVTRQVSTQPGVIPLRYARIAS